MHPTYILLFIENKHLHISEDVLVCFVFGERLEERMPSIRESRYFTLI